MKYNCLEDFKDEKPESNTQRITVAVPPSKKELYDHLSQEFFSKYKIKISENIRKVILKELADLKKFLDDKTS